MEYREVDRVCVCVWPVCVYTLDAYITFRVLCERDLIGLSKKHNVNYLQRLRTR